MYPGSSEHSSNSNEDIDLRDLIIGLFNGRWIIVGVTSLFTILAVAYIALVPQTQKAAMVIQKVDTFVAAHYAPLSNTGFLQVNSGSLSNWFFEDPTPVLVENMIKLSYVEKQPEETDQAYALLVGQAASSFQILPPSEDEKARIKRPNWTLSFTTTKPELARQLVADTFTGINTSMLTKLQAQFAFNIKQYKTSIANQLVDIDLKIASNEAGYNANVTRKVAVLSEQAQIARSLGIANNQLVSNMDGNKDMVVLANQSLPTYLNGYIALEKEIALLKKRGAA